MVLVTVEVRVLFPAWRSGLKDLALPLILWCVTAAAQIQSLTWEFPHAQDVNQKKILLSTGPLQG